MSKPDADKTGQDGEQTRGGLTLEQYAEVVAHLLHFASRSPVEVLARFGLDEVTFRAAEVGFRITLAEESMQFRTRSLKTFAKRTKEAIRKLEDEQPELSAVGSPMGNADGVVAPAEGASSDPAKPARAMAAPMPATPDGEQRAPAMPSYAIAAAKAAAVLPAVSPAPAPVAPPAAVAIATPAVVSPLPVATAPMPDPLEDVAPDSAATFRYEPGEAAPAQGLDEASTARGLPRDPAIIADDGEGTHTTNILKKRSGTAVFEAPPGLTDSNTSTHEPTPSPFGRGVLPFTAASAGSANPLPALEPSDEPIDMSGGTVVAQSPFAKKALPWEKTQAPSKHDEPAGPPSASGGQPAPGGDGSSGGQGVTVEGMTVEQYASLCAEIAVKPTQSAEIEKRYRLSSAARHKLDAAFREHFARDPALQTRFKVLAQQYRAWLEKNLSSGG